MYTCRKAAHVRLGHFIQLTACRLSLNLKKRNTGDTKNLQKNDATAETHFKIPGMERRILEMNQDWV